MTREIINLKDVQSYFGIRKNAAFKKTYKVRKHFSIAKRTPITATQFCEVHGLDYKHFSEALNKRKQ